MQNYKAISVGLAVVLLMIATAGASVYLTKRPSPATSAHITEKVVVREPVQKKCNDGNIAGKALGGVGGGVLGSMVGKGDGKTAATIGGTLGGAYIGGEAIPLNNITCGR